MFHPVYLDDELSDLLREPYQINASDQTIRCLQKLVENMDRLSQSMKSTLMNQHVYLQEFKDTIGKKVESMQSMSTAKNSIIE